MRLLIINKQAKPLCTSAANITVHLTAVCPHLSFYFNIFACECAHRMWVHLYITCRAPVRMLTLFSLLFAYMSAEEVEGI